MTPLRPPTQPEYLRIGELAEQADVSVATIKYYIREGLLSPPPVKTGRTMGYYDRAYLERLILIRQLREEHYLPLRVIRAILADRGDAPLAPGEAAVLARVAPSLVEKLDRGTSAAAAAAALPATRDDVLARYRMTSDELDLVEQMGLVGDGVAGQRHYSAPDLELLDAMARAEAVGLTRDRFPVEGLGHYVELLGELARREVRRFTKQVETLPPAEIEALAQRAIEVSEPIVALLRRKLILRALRAELERPPAAPVAAAATAATRRNGTGRKKKETP